MASSVAITIVTAEEKVKGRLATINGLSGMERIDRLAVAYRTFQTTLDDLKNFRYCLFRIPLAIVIVNYCNRRFG